MKRFVQDLEAIAAAIDAKEYEIIERLVVDLLGIMYAPIIGIVAGDPRRAVVLPDNPAIRVRALECCLLQYAAKLGVLEPIDAEERLALGLSGGIAGWAMRLVEAAIARHQELQRDLAERNAAALSGSSDGSHLN